MEYTAFIVQQVAGWPGVVTDRRDDGVAIDVADRELGHVYDAGLVDLAVARPVRDQLLTDGLADRHHLDPTSDWVSCRVRSPADVDCGLRLLRVAYLCRLLAQRVEGGATPDRLDPFAELERLSLSRELVELIRRTYRPTVPGSTPTPA